MAKRKARREKADKNKLIPQMQKMRFKGDQVNDERLENYELSEEFMRKNPLKTPPNNTTGKKRKS
jgi:hypothetical protein